MMVHQIHKNMKTAVFVVLFLCLQASLAWAAASHSSGDLYYLAQKSYYQLKKSPDKQKFRHHWENVIQKFSKVVKHYPRSQQAYKAVFTMARLYAGLSGISKNSKDLNQALHYYKKVSSDYSGGTLTDDALFESAQIYKDKKDFSSAAKTLKTIYEKYPKGDQAKKARLEYKRLASVSQVGKIKKQPTTAKITQPKRLKKVRPAKVVVKQAVLAKPKKPINKTTLAKQNKKQDKPVAKSVVTAKAKLPAKTPVKKALFKKSKGGHLFAPSSSKAQTPTIVVDAGHGGKDQGAKSAKGLHEKDINLTIARHVKTILVNRFKYRVVMTRKDDTFIPLKERSEIANNRNAELFVSIHANAAKRKSAHGIETYFLGTTHNDDALATAARENGELVYSVKDDQVQQILASLITTTKINDSSRLAGTVQENLYKSSKKKFRELKNLGVKEGPFYVLHGADMPSILVEVGFLTNRKEANMLSKPDYLYRLASSIAEGIHKFMLDKRPTI